MTMAVMQWPRGPESETQPPQVEEPFQLGSETAVRKGVDGGLYCRLRIHTFRRVGCAVEGCGAGVDR